MAVVKKITSTALVLMLTIPLAAAVVVLSIVLPVQMNRRFEAGHRLGYSEGWRDANEYRDGAPEEFHFHLSWGTLATLYSSLLFMQNNIPTYVYMGRRNTFNIDQMPGHVTHLFTGYGNHIPTDHFTNAQILNELRTHIQRIDAETEGGARFHIFIEEWFMMVAWNALLTSSICESRFQITLLSSGAGDMITPAPWDASGISQFPQRRTEFEAHLQQFRNNTGIANDVAFAFNMSNGGRYKLVAAQRPNVRFLFQFPEYYILQPNLTNEVRAELMRTNIVKKQPVDLLNMLPQYRQQTFFNAVLNNPNNRVDGQPLTRALLDTFLLREEEDKPVLIVSGTWDWVGPNNDQVVFPQPAVFQQIVDEFGDDFEIMFKPHPTGMPTGTLLTWLNNNNIRVLPPQIPMEVLMWAYPDSFIGGYSSSLYAAIPASQVLFFVGDLFGTINFLDKMGFFSYATVRFAHQI